MNNQSTTSFSDLVAEGVSNPVEFTKVMPAAQEHDSSLVMFKLLQTLSNFHDSVADLYSQNGEKGKAAYHYQMANRIRTEAQQSRRAAK